MFVFLQNQAIGSLLFLLSVLLQRAILRPACDGSTDRRGDRRHCRPRRIAGRPADAAF
jgi:hypothetical protein